MKKAFLEKAAVELVYKFEEKSYRDCFEKESRLLKYDFGPQTHIYISECSSTLYIGLARTAPPTYTNFRLTFVITRLQEALYEDLSV